MPETQNGEQRELRRQSGDRQLVIEDVSTFYGGAQALKNLSLSVNTNETVAILGSNGAGKTTLLRTLTGLLMPKYGEVIFEGQPITGKAPNEIIKKGIASVPEGRELFGSMSVWDNLLLGSYSLSRKEKREILETRLEMIFNLFPVLKNRLEQNSETLSGGEQQMLALGRALMANPKFLALDEPSLGLAPLLVTQMMKLLKSVCLEWGLSILLVEQNARAAIKIADYVYVMERGEIRLEGEPDEVMASPNIQSAYLGA